jgi:pimeloyl-ACP methyl ester carboxylesterase
VRAVGEGPPVLLIHGTAAAVWGDVPERLAAAGRRVIEYDRRGLGGSSGGPGASLAEHAFDAGSLLDGPTLVVGWSMGGLVALELAIGRPELVTGLVLIEPPLHVRSHPSRQGLAALPRAALARNPRRGAEHVLRWVCRSTSAGGGWEALRAADREAMLANARAIVGELRHTGTGEELTAARLAGVNVPVLWLYGAQSDPAFRRAARRAGRLLPRATFREVPGAAHPIQLERPDAVLGAVAELAG